MTLKLIKNKADLEEALQRLEIIFDAQPNTPEGDELEVLSLLISNYEDEYSPIEYPDPIEAIKFRMEQLGCTQTELAAITGSKSRTSELLNKKRKLTLSMIRKLHDALNIPTDILIQPY